eukprot:6468058-Amphidinium_carterae.1
MLRTNTQRKAKRQNPLVDTILLIFPITAVSTDSADCYVEALTDTDELVRLSKRPPPPEK